jgi:hypothetical protein
LIRSFKDFVVDPVVVVFAIIRVIVTANLGAGVINPASIIRQEMTASLVDHDVPLLVLDEDIDVAGPVHDIPAKIVEILFRLRLVNGKGDVLAALGGAVLAEIRVFG